MALPSASSHLFFVLEEEGNLRDEELTEELDLSPWIGARLVEDEMGTNSRGEMVLYSSYFGDGVLRLPFPNLVRRALYHYGLSPNQVNVKVYKIHGCFGPQPTTQSFSRVSDHLRGVPHASL